MKVQISLDDELMVKIDSFADMNYMSRSGLISSACVQYLANIEVATAIKDMAIAMKKIADNDNKIDKETLEKLRDFELLSKMISGS